MTSIISDISGQFSKSLILGTFLPTLLFVVLSLIFVLPLFPSDRQVLQQLEGAETQGVLAVSFFTVVLTGLLYNMNGPVIRFYEGYTWQYSFVGRLRADRYRRLLVAALELRPRLQDVQDGMPAPDPSKSEARIRLNRDLGAARGAAARILLREMPESPDSVLPTKLGNVIRSFEVYPRRQYRMSAIPLWPRLLAKIDKEYAEQIDGAKTSFDFMINCSLLSFFLALLILFVGLWYPVMFAATRHWAAWLFKALFFVALSYAFYHSSIGRAASWGDMVKGAFDLYRHDLLAQFGYESAPASIDEERRLWDSISQQLLYGDAPRGPHLLPFKDAATSARCEPETVRLRVTRGLQPTDADDVYAVTLRVSNSDRYGRDAKGVVLTDKLPEGFAYLWDSARVVEGADWAAGNGAPASDDGLVSGTSAVRFVIGTLAAGTAATVRYHAIKYPSADDSSPPARAIKGASNSEGKDASSSDGAAKPRAEVRHE